jgi:hypothetical protein
MKIADIVEPMVEKIVSRHDDLRYKRHANFFEIWVGPDDDLIGFIGCISDQVRHRARPARMTPEGKVIWESMEIMSTDKDFDLGDPELDLYEELKDCIIQTWEEFIELQPKGHV